MTAVNQLEQRNQNWVNNLSQDLPVEKNIDPPQIDVENDEPKQEEPKSLWSKLHDKAQDVAEIVCSRESTYRTALDIVGYELPGILADATRNVYSFLETSLEGVLAAGSIWLAPKITKIVANLAAKSIFSGEDAKNSKFYSLFQISELDNLDSAEKAKSKIVEEEKNDLSFISNLYKKRGKDTSQFTEKAQGIENFMNTCQLNEEKVEKIKELKRRTVIAESFIEGGFWGSLPMLLKAFRKYVLKKDRFTGTLGYMNEEERKKAGDSSKYNLLQKIGMGSAVIATPIVNKLLINKTKDPQAVEKSSFLKMVKNKFDTTHGAYPKLELLFSFIMPNIISELSSAQGKYEFMEKLVRLCTVLPSWMFGHKVTNGLLAKNADKKLAEKFGVERGILVEQDELKKNAPEPAKIQHIFDKTKGNTELRKEARRLHSNALYQGFGLHCLGIFGIRYLTTLFTKFRARKDIAAS